MNGRGEPWRTSPHVRITKFIEDTFKCSISISKPSASRTQPSRRESDDSFCTSHEVSINNALQCFGDDPKNGNRSARFNAPASFRFHFFLRRQLPFVPAFFPGVGSYPSQQGLGFAALGFVFFAVFFLVISDLKSKKFLSDIRVTKSTGSHTASTSPRPVDGESHTTFNPTRKP